MRDSAFDPPSLPDAFWVRPDVSKALADQDIGALLWLVNKRGGISQIKIGTAAEMSQTRVSLVSRGLQDVRELALITRIANGLAMPDHARIPWASPPAMPPLPPPRPAARRRPGRRATAPHHQRPLHR